MNAPSALTGSVARIAVLRANALGDYIFCLPALEALKAAWPDAELVYIGKSWHRDFLTGRPGPVDRVVVIPDGIGFPDAGRDGGNNAAEAKAFFARMRAEKFDLALQMHGGGGNSNAFLAQIGARLTIGLKAENAPSLDVNIPYNLYHHEILRYLEIVSVAGARPVTVEPRISVTDRDHNELERAVPQLRRPFVVLHPGATDVRRRWPAAKVAQVADTLAERFDVCISGTDAEADIVGEVLAATSAPVTNLCGQLSLGAFVALLAGADMLVSNDTGPLHLARAVGTPTVGTYWIGNVVNASPVNSQGHGVCISWTTRCPRCGMDCIRYDAHAPRNGCDHAVSFLDSIEVADVLEQVHRQLAYQSAMFTNADRKARRASG